MNFSRLEEGMNTTFEIEASLDALSAADLRPVIEEIVDHTHTDMHVIVDVSHLDLIDASGVGALVAIYKRVHSNHGEVAVHGLVGQPVAIFRLLKLDRIFAEA